jgi:hypothetical protein
MESRKVTHGKWNMARRKKSAIKRFFLVALSVLIILSGGIVPTNAEYLIPMKDIPKLSQVGPIHEDNGYPVWYRDHDGTRLELCLDVDDPYCAWDPAEIPDPTKPLSLAGKNWPEEAFYQLAGSEIDLPSGGSAIATFALEAAWANEIVQNGDQIVFGRVRFRIDDLKTGETYTITHPYGKDEYVAVDEDEDEPGIGEIRFVEDIGIAGGFEGATKSRIGSFLEWDTGAPEGYVGDPNVDHKIKGGLNNQNFFRIEGPGIGVNAPVANRCPEVSNNCIQTDLFSLMGKKAVNSGVDVARATYTENVNVDGNPTGDGTIDVFASTEADEKDYNLEVSGTGETVPMMGTKGKYYARVKYTGDTPPELTITNKTDNPDSVKKVTPVDSIITSKALYRSDVNPNEIVITAYSSDANSPALSVPEFKDADGKARTLTNGQLVITTPTYIPPYITINSEKGGTVTIPVEVVGEPLNPPVADAGEAQTVKAGDTVILDGSKSAGSFETVEWIQISPETQKVALLTGVDPLKPTFIAPNGIEEMVFELKLTGPEPNLAVSTKRVTITIVDAVAAPVANIVGPDQPVTQGSEVTLDASGSTNATEFTWTQVSGPKVTFNLADPKKPKFFYPKENKPVVLSLTVKNVAGEQNTKEITLNTKSEKIAITAAEYRLGEWRIDGTSAVVGPGVTVTIYLGNTNQIIGSAAVDTTGVWRFRGTSLRVTGTGTVTAKSPTSTDVPSLPYRYR